MPAWRNSRSLSVAELRHVSVCAHVVLANISTENAIQAFFSEFVIEMQPHQTIVRLVAVPLIVALAACSGGGSTSTVNDGTTNTAVPAKSAAATATLIALSASTYPVPQSATQAVVSVRRVGQSTGEVSVDYTTVNGTATAGIDYSGESGTLTWMDGDSTPKSIDIPITSEAIGRSFFLTLTSLTGAASFGSPTSANIAVANTASSGGSSSSGGSTTSSSSGVATSSSSSSGASLSPTTPAFYVAPNGSDANNGTLLSPFATLSQAQSAMRFSTTKTSYIRAGTYSNISLTLTASDSSETWSYYPPDGYNTAILDGGASGPGNGQNVITVLGASNVTVNGLLIQNYRQWGIGIHGGQTDTPNGFTSDTAAANDDTFINNSFKNGYTTLNQGWGGGAIFGIGLIQSLTIANNVAVNQYGSCYRVGASNGDGGRGTQPGYNISGLTIKNNVCLVSNQATGDNGAIYIQDENEASTNITISNNFVRDYQNNPALRNGNTPIRDVAVYLDTGSSNVTIDQNVIANTAYAIQGSTSVPSTMAFYTSDGHNNKWYGNLVDLGTAGLICNFDYEWDGVGSSTTGNVVTSNLFIANWSGAQACFGSANGPFAYPSGGAPSMVLPSVSNNFYYNYGSGSMSTRGDLFSDSAPTTGVDPSIGPGFSYPLNANSPAYDSPTGFPGIPGNWGPPGYVIPAGTAPSS
jgi:hypothetical protein